MSPAILAHLRNLSEPGKGKSAYHSTKPPSYVPTKIITVVTPNTLLAAIYVVLQFQQDFLRISYCNNK
eukprot:5746811-Amphidinium_carterae.1